MLTIVSRKKDDASQRGSRGGGGADPSWASAPQLPPGASGDARSAAADASQDDAQLLRTAERLHAGALHLLRRLRRNDAKTGVGPARLSALSVLVFAGPRSLGELAAAEQVRPPTMTRIVAGLERGGLVRRRPDPTDARRAVLEATPRGRRLMEAGRRRRVEDLAE